MAAKLWCVAPSNPVVRQIAEKYNLTKKQAITIYNNATEYNPLLQGDDVTLEFMESQQSFQDALGKFVDKYIETSNLFETPFKERDVEEIKNQLKEAGENYSDDFVEDIIRRSLEVQQTSDLSKIGTEKLFNLLKAFPNTKRLDFLGNWVCHYISELVTSIQVDPSIRQEHNIPERRTRAEYMRDPNTMSQILRVIRTDMKDAAKELSDSGDINKATELITAANKLDILMYMYGGNLFRDEGVEVGPDGIITTPDIDAEDISRNESDPEDGTAEDDETDEETPVDYTGVSDQNKSVLSKIVPDIKTMLASCRDTAKDGSDKIDQYGYGLWRYISVPQAVNKLLKICKGCQTFSEMVEALKSNSENTPWVLNLLDAMDTQTDIAVDGISQMSESKKEQLQTMFFKSFRKLFTPFTHTYIRYDEQGFPYFVNTTSNVRDRYENIFNKVQRKFRNSSGLAIFRGNSGIDFTSFQTLQRDVLGGARGRLAATTIPYKMAIVRSAASAAVNNLTSSDSTPDFTDAYRALADAENTLRNTLQNYFGIEVEDQEWEDYLNNDPSGTLTDDAHVSMLFGGNTSLGDKRFAMRYHRINKLHDYTKRLNDQFLKWGAAIDEGATTDGPKRNPFGKKEGTAPFEGMQAIRNWYRNIITELTDFSADSFESSAYFNGKSYYSWNNPSSTGVIVESLTKKNGQKVKDYILEKYGQDKEWFIRPAREGEDEDEIHFYSDMLDDLYNHENSRDILEYDEKPTVCGKSYDDISEPEYNISMLNDYFTTIGERSGTARYRMLINSDKPKYARLRWKRYANRDIDQQTKLEADTHYHNVITNKAVDFFEQELRRARRVVSFAATGRGIKFKDYDIKINDENKPIINKVKKKEKVTVDDVLDSRGKYIFRNTGAAFFLNKFIQDEIENKTALGTAVVNAVFNGNIDTALDANSIRDFKTGFRQYMEDIRNDYFSYLNDIGVLETKLVDSGDPEEGSTEHLKNILANLKQWHANDPLGYENFLVLMYSNNSRAKAMADQLGIPYNSTSAPGIKEMYQFREDLDEFVYNNYLAKANMSQVFDVDLAFYGGTPNFQKRNAQTASSGYPIDVEAKIHGDKVCDGKYRSITIKTPKIQSPKIQSPNYSNIKTALDKFEATLTDPKHIRNFRAEKKRVLDELKSFDSTDGQGLTSLSGFRKRQAGLGEWSRSDTKQMDDLGYEEVNGVKHYIYTDEAIYQRIKRGYSREADQKAKYHDLMHVFGQTQKPFVYSLAHKRRGKRTITAPTQLKNSEYMLAFLTAFTRDTANRTAEPQSQMEAIAWFLEETADAYPTSGVDTANFDSVVKIGEDSGAIDITGLDGKQTLDALRKAAKAIDIDSAGSAVYGDTVTVYDAKDYKIQQVKNEHFKNSRQQIGSQMKVLSISNVHDEATVTLPNGKSITGKELKNRYFDALLKKLDKAETHFRYETGANFPEQQRVHMLSNMLKRAMATDQKFSSDARRSLSVVDKNGTDKFVLPLDDPSIQSAVEAMMYSKIRGVYYKEKSNGGIVVQATSWGGTSDLAIRFRSSSPIDADIERNGVKGVMPTLQEYLADRRYGENRTEESYEKYKNDYQGDYSHFEAEIPMQDHVRNMLLNKDGVVDRKYFNDDGTWNMEEIRRVVPDSVFDAICYRIPTEAKYSMMVCRIARFSPEASGSTAKYPQELTVFTGSDFDIDTDTIELRPTNNSETAQIDNELFDLQLAALRSQGAIQETFKTGDFSDLSELSYRALLLDKGYSPEYLNTLDKKKLKALCAEEEDMDLMSPKTDSLLKRQNSGAKSMIGIAAVGVTSHAFMSLYNDVHRGDTRPEDHPDDFIRISYKEPEDSKSVCEAFTIINDSDPNNVTQQRFGDGGYAFYDMMYDMDGGLISSQISKYVGASADAAKDAAEDRLNITPDTLPVVIFMHRQGMSGQVARLFMSHPVIKGFCDYLKSSESSSRAIVAAGEYAEKLVRRFGKKEDQKNSDTLWEQAKTSRTKELRFSDLARGKYDPTHESISKKLDLLAIFVNQMQKAHSVRPLDDFVRYNSAKAMKGSSFFDRYAARQKLFRLDKKLNEEDDPAIILPNNVEIPEGVPPGNIGKLCAMFPYIGRTILGEEQLVDSILLDNMKTYGPVFFEIVDTLGVEDNADAMKKIYAGWKNYLLFVGQNRIADFTDKEVAEFYTTKFAKHYDQVMNRLQKEEPEFYKNVIKDNTFLKKMEHTPSKDGFKKFDMLSMPVAKLSGEPLENFQKDWEDLLNHPQTRRLATDIAIHFLARSAAFSRDTPVHVMPLKIKEAIPNYINVFENADKNSMTDDEFETVLEMIALNNATDKNIVPAIRRKKKSFTASYKDGNLMLDFNTASYAMQNVLYVDENKAIRTAVPLIRIDDEYYIFTDNELTASTIGEGKEAQQVLVAHVAPIKPLGIPNQMAEYTGLDEPLFQAPEDAESDVAHANATETETIVEPEEYGVKRTRVGTRVEYEPLQSEYIGSGETILSRTAMDQTQGVLESRANLKRFARIADAMGLKMSTAHRSTSFGSHDYQISVIPKTHGEDTHEAAVKTAAIIHALSNNSKKTAPVVKTYVTDENEYYDTVEITMPILKADDIKNAISDAEATGMDFYFDQDENAVVFNIDITDLNAEDLSNMATTVKQLKRKYGTTYEVNYARTTVVTNVEEILNEIIEENETDTGTAGEENQTTGKQAKKVTGRGYRLSDGKQIGLGDLASLALRKIQGEKVNDEIRQLFGERRHGLANTSSSIQSREFVDAVTTDLKQADMIDEISRLAGDTKTRTRESTEDKMDNFILNVANWIIGNRPQGSVEELLSANGVSEESAATIISTIERQLKEKDIC